MNEPWSNILAKSFIGADLAPLSCDRVVVGSDYSGDDGTKWWTLGYLLFDWDDYIQQGEPFDELVNNYGKPPSFKEIHGKHNLTKTQAFLDACDSLRGNLISVSFRSKLLKELTFTKGSAIALKQKGVFLSDWSNPTNFERAARITHVLSRIIEISTTATAEVEWWSDHDQVIETEHQRRDIVSMVSSFRRHYQTSDSPAIKLAPSDDPKYKESTAILTAAADIIAGHSNNTLKQDTKFEERQMPGTSHQVKIDTNTNNSARSILIQDWLNKTSPTLTKTRIVVHGTSDNIIFSRLSKTSK